MPEKGEETLAQRTSRQEARRSFQHRDLFGER